MIAMTMDTLAIWSSRKKKENRGKSEEKAIDDLEMTVVRCKPETIGALCKSTQFTKDEIKRIYQGFKQSCPTGLVNENTFKDMYCQFFPLADTAQYAHYVFRALDTDRSGTINFKDFVMGLSVLSRGSPQEKLQWAFNLYDINKDGAVTKEEMFEIISSVYSLLGHYAAPLVVDHSAREHAARVFQKLDLNNDGIVTYDEFIEACLLDEDILKSLTVLDTVLD
ncbi:Kv channel-interacting protein 4-like isoform X2 [Ornithodoros turicata]|uniref:Kv channel-interacting protein 4-like isoform X2 n=1 Tax=Ornithodoros turicata TaxID=34597 RepID=UPI00313912AA